MKVTVYVDDERLNDMVTEMIAKRDYENRGSGGMNDLEIRKAIEKGIDDLISENKEMILKKATEQAAEEIARKGIQRYLDFLKKQYYKNS